jgi:2-polyprenyl-6-methoxyphenol hydroxylase-like FAD-dependent oxidoreductase
MATGFAGKHAVVVGASMAGLCAARVLAEHFAHVTVIEKELLGEGAEPRTAVPQGAHAHGLLARGYLALKELFAGIDAELERAGAVHADLSELAFHQFGVWKKQRHAGIDGVFVTRPGLEHIVRQRVLAMSNVTVLRGHRLTELLLDERGRQVAGVRIQSSDAVARSLPAELVIDATGRGSRTPDMLVRLGFGKARVSEVGVDVGYATRMFKRGDFVQGWKAMLVTPTPPHTRRLGAFFPVEGERWIVTLGGWFGDHPPNDEAGFMAFARSLPSRDLHERVRQLEPIGAIKSYRFSSSLRRHYEELALPEGFNVLGDAAASFNPIYGQGMTVAALEALGLRDCLRKQPGELAGLSRAVQRMVARTIDIPWTVAVGEDLRYPEAVGPRPLPQRIINAYLARVHRVSAHDAEVAMAFQRVMHMLEAPPSLLHPRTLLRVLTASTALPRAAPLGLLAPEL